MGKLTKVIKKNITNTVNVKDNIAEEVEVNKLIK